MITLPGDIHWDFKKGDRVRVRFGRSVPNGTEGTIVCESNLEDIWLVRWDGWGTRTCHPLQMEFISPPEDCEKELRNLANRLGFDVRKKA